VLDVLEASQVRAPTIDTSSRVPLWQSS